MHPLVTNRRKIQVILCLGVIALAWAGLIFFAQQRTKWAINLTHELFAWTILATYFGLWAALTLGTRKSKLCIFHSIMVTFTLVIILGIFEAAAAIRIVHWQLIFERIAGDGTNYFWSYVADSDLGFRRQPNDHWSGRPTSDVEMGSLMPATLSEPISFTYDRWGYRNATDLDQADVALIGDSYTEGWYVSDDETAASRLSAYLRRPVANLGIAGYGPLQELIVLQKDATRFNPKVVVWFFFEGNDLYDDYEFERNLPVYSTWPDDIKGRPEGFTREHGWKERSFVRNLLVRLRRWSYSILPTWPSYSGRLNVTGHDGRIVYFADYPTQPWSDWILSQWKKTQETLQKAVEYTRDHNIRLLFAFVPIKFRVYQPFVDFSANSPENSWSTWPIDEYFLQFCRSVSVPCIDLTPIFQNAVAEGGMPYAAVDTHWGPEGHDLVARVLKAELKRRGWLHSNP